VSPHPFRKDFSRMDIKIRAGLISFLT